MPDYFVRHIRRDERECAECGDRYEVVADRGKPSRNGRELAQLMLSL